MNKDNAKAFLPLVQALAEGKKLEWRRDNGRWEEVSTLSDRWPASYYRIKPEPREIWYNRYETGIESGPYRSKEKAIERAHHEYKMVQVCYREVIE